jgi:hypothetical protein
MADVQQEIALKVTTDVGQTTTALKSAEERLTEAKKAMLDLAMAGKQGSKEFRDLAVEAGALKGKIESVEQTVDGLGKSANKIEVFTGAVQGIAAGFAIAQGTAALFAEGNEEVQEALLKVQASLALLQGTEQAVQLLRKESAAGQALLTARTAAYNVVVGASTGALKLFRIALVSTGIGAAVVAVGLLVANFDKVTKAITDFVSGSPALTKVLSFIGDTFTSIGESLGFVEDKTTKNLRTQIEAAEKQKRLLEAQGKDTEAVERSILKMKLEVAKRTKEGVNEAQEEITIFEAEQTLKREEAAKEAAKKKGELDKAATAKAKEAAKAAAQIQVELNQELENLQAQNIANEEARALAQLELERKRARQQLEDKKASDALLIEFDKQTEIQRKAITDQAQADRDAKAKEDSDKVLANAKIVADALQQARIDSIKNEFDRAQAELEIQRQAKIEELTLAGASAEEINAVNQSFADKSVKIAKDAAAEQKAVKEAQIANDIDMTMQGLQALSDLAASFAGESEEQQKRAFAIQKGVSIAMAIIETYLSASKAYTSQLTPGDPTSPIRAYIAAGIAIAGGLARVNAIRKTQFKSTSPPANTGGGGGGIPTGGGGQQQIPGVFNPNVTPTNPTGQPNPQGGQNGTTRVIVVESDIRRVTTRVDAAERFATFGN